MGLFHYTSVEAVHSMLTNRKIWLTDVRFLNDSQELLNGIANLNEALLAPTHGLFSDSAYHAESLDYLAGAFRDSVSFGIAEEPIFVFSLGGAEDLLSQWRGYGGYAIEFKPEMFSGHFADVRQCVYEETRKKKLAQTAVTRALTDISNDMARNSGSIGTASIDAVSKLVKLAATFKDKGFFEEQEARLIVEATEVGSEIRYRPKGGYLVPYIELELDLACVSAVHVGPVPHQQLALTSMTSFVQDVERNWQADASNIEYELAVRSSLIPFRGT